MQTKIIGIDQLHGNGRDKENGRLYLTRGNGAVYAYLPKDGRLSINIRFNISMNITGISVQGKAAEPTRFIQFTKRYAVNVNYDDEDKKDYSLGEVSRKRFYVFLWLCFFNQIKLICDNHRSNLIECL